MKSSAFNLAFKVHRNELTFEQGILQSNEEDAAQDFLDALNSLAGKVKYDPSQLPLLLEQAQAVAAAKAGTAPLSVDLTALKEEINNLHKKKRDIEEGISTLKSICARRQPMITPGVNSILLLIIFSVFVALLFIFDQPLVAVPAIVVGLAAAGMVYMKDLKTLHKQQEEARRRRAKNEAEISKLENMLVEIQQQLEAKELQLQTVQKKTPADLLGASGPSLPNEGA